MGVFILQHREKHTLGKTLLLGAMLSCAALTSVAWATDIRGRVDNYSGSYPQPYVVVVIYLDNSRSGELEYIDEYTTGTDGLYYFYEIEPGHYLLEIDGEELIPIRVPKQRNYDLRPYKLYE